MVLPSLADGAAFASLSYLDLRENGVDGKAVVRVASSIPALQGRTDADAPNSNTCRYFTNTALVRSTMNGLI